MSKRCYPLLALCLALLLCLALPLGAAASDGVDPQEVQVPIVIELSGAIAGAEFEIEYTNGLELLRFEKSDTVQSANSTPVVYKDGKAYFGFYNGSNDYAPEDGALNVGTLVFSYAGAQDQSVKLTEVKYVEVVDKETTNSTLLTLNKVIKVPSDGYFLVGNEADPLVFWLIGGLVALIAAIVAFAIVRSRKTRKKRGSVTETIA